MTTRNSGICIEGKREGWLSPFTLVAKVRLKVFLVRFVGKKPFNFDFGRWSIWQVFVERDRISNLGQPIVPKVCTFFFSVLLWEN